MYKKRDKLSTHTHRPFECNTIRLLGFHHNFVDIRVFYFWGIIVAISLLIEYAPNSFVHTSTHVHTCTHKKSTQYKFRMCLSRWKLAHGLYTWNHIRLVCIFCLFIHFCCDYHNLWSAAFVWRCSLSYLCILQVEYEKFTKALSHGEISIFFTRVSSAFLQFFLRPSMLYNIISRCLHWNRKKKKMQNAIKQDQQSERLLSFTPISIHSKCSQSVN